ncbi:mechanosensitive ion channel family protein [Rhizobium grahamii]|uniref:Small-conductance mechanosensitive channel n=1 Tax=Rhizobium grahamii TaxID=1120045 RepID=A0A370KTI9_9HYPH|nr:mechanosensitive ion channel family protein [Rhizobium grahamii]RDJ13949.1 small mechanosensitive ion channel [Rhizobium grahamii]
MPNYAYLITLVNVLGVAGIVVWHLQGRSRPNERLVVQIAFFLSMTVALAFARLNPFHFEAPHMDSGGTLVVTAKTLWWTHLSWATIGFVRIYIVLDGRPREARLIQDLLVAIVYLGVLLSILAFVFGVPVGTLLATSGLVAIILGLALQNTLADVFSGIALTLGRPYGMGDWILLDDGTEGRVTASNWRSTYLLTGAHNLVVLPNNVLAKQGLTNVSKPDENHQITLPIRLVRNRRPRFVLDIMQEALNNCNSIVQNPPPAVALTGISGSAIEMELLFRVTGPAQRAIARNEVIDLVHQHCNAHDLTLADPVGTQIIAARDELEPAPTTAEKLFGSAPLLAGLSAAERTDLSTAAKPDEAAAGSTIMTKGATPQSIVILRSGIVALLEDGEEFARLAPGDYLGAKSLLGGKPEPYEAKAFTRVAFFRIDKSDLDAVIASRPSIEQDLVLRTAEPQTARHVTDAPVHSQPAKADLVLALRSAFRST